LLANISRVGNRQALQTLRGRLHLVDIFFLTSWMDFSRLTSWALRSVNSSPSLLTSG
jgi:hypothetical protein